MPTKASTANLEFDFSPTGQPRSRAKHLSKSRFVAGKQCHKRLWWETHEPLAVELQPNIVLQDRFDQAAQVAKLAQEQFPGGLMIPSNPDRDARVEATWAAMDAGATTIYEASFFADDTFVAVDILLREESGWRLIEVKSSKSVKDEHLVDTTLQLYVVERSGVKVTGVDVMHLNPECQHPDLSDLLVRMEVTQVVRELVLSVPAEIRAQRAMLGGGLPETKIGLHCSEPYDCPFQERCWPKDEDHISRLYMVGRGKRCDEYMKAGVHVIGDIPPKKKLSEPAKRQIRAMREQRMIVEDGLAAALGPFNCRLGFLDFETIQRAVPVWPGMGPWDQEPAQFSYHEFDYSGAHLTPEDEDRGHLEFLAEGPKDCRSRLAEQMVAATRNAERVVSFSAFEKTRIRGLQESVPDLRNELLELEHKLIDLLPVLREHAYHPQFQGSFSLKVVLPAMVPELTYKDLVIVDGLVASVEIARLLFVAGKLPESELDCVRRDLLAYCKRDTWAMVKLLERLRSIEATDSRNPTREPQS